MSQKEKPGNFTMKSKSSKTKLEKSSGTSYQAIGFCLVLSGSLAGFYSPNHPSFPSPWFLALCGFLSPTRPFSISSASTPELSSQCDFPCPGDRKTNFMQKQTFGLPTCPEIKVSLGLTVWRRTVGKNPLLNPIAFQFLGGNMNHSWKRSCENPCPCIVLRCTILKLHQHACKQRHILSWQYLAIWFLLWTWYVVSIQKSFLYSRVFSRQMWESPESVGFLLKDTKGNHC